MEGDELRSPGGRDMLTTWRRVLAPALALVVAIGVPALPATAGITNPVDCNVDPSAPECSVQVEVPGAPGNPGRTSNVPCRMPDGAVVPCSLPGVGWLADDGCYYQPAVEMPSSDVPGGQGRWYFGYCGYPPNEDVVKYRWFASPPGPQQLADEAVRALRPPAPVIRLNPAPPVAQLVRLPSWVWLDPSSWGPRTATASVPGMSVTATATPTKVVFTAGDGTSFTCTGPGTPWNRGMNPAAKSPTCGHTYTRAGTFTLTATVTWTITWAGGGQTGTAPALTTTSSLGVRVTESQALVTR
jgi:hypothetical protein